MRHGLINRWQKLAENNRDYSRPLVWFHAPSVGEGLQARPIIDRLRSSHPEFQIAYSFFSPSAEQFASSLNVEMAEYLPFDSARESNELFDIIAPNVLAFVKLDVWPNFAAAASQRKIPTVLLSATVAPRSKRQGAFASMLLRDAYQSLSAVGAIDSSDAERLRQMGVRDGALAVTGDTRFDQVWARTQNLNRNSAMLVALRNDAVQTVVAGSTWPSDEKILLPAFAALKRKLSSARLLIAPHEPTPTHVNPIREWAIQNRLSHATLSSISAHPMSADVVVVDSVGVLGDLYDLADVAFVGGGFHSAGLHSVLEPAAYGKPVVFGPNYHMSRDAQLLLQSGSAQSVTTASDLAETMFNWLTNDAVRHDVGAKAAAVVTKGLGAAERSLQVLLQALQQSQLLPSAVR